MVRAVELAEPFVVGIVAKPFLLELIRSLADYRSGPPRHRKNAACKGFPNLHTMFNNDRATLPH